MNVKHTLLGLSAAAACSLMAGSVFAQGDDPARRDPASATLQADQQADQNNQQNNQNQRNDQNRQQGEQRQGRNQDRDSQAEVTQNLAAWLALGNYSEVQLGQLATERAQNQQVKQFAQMAVRDHQRALEQLQKLAPQVDPSEWQSAQAADQGAQRNQQNAATAQGRDQNQADNNRGGREGRGRQGRYDEMSRIGMQAGLNKLQLTREMLSEKSGADFDKCYMGQQIVAHTCMLGELRAMNNAGSQEFQGFVAQAEKVTQQHLDEAKQIAKSLESSQGQNQGERREGREGRRTGERIEGSSSGGARINNAAPGGRAIEGRRSEEQIQPEQSRPSSNPTTNPALPR